jgi:uncharacterized protein YbcI
MSNIYHRQKHLETLLSQKIKIIYQENLEQQIDDVYYRLFDRTLIVVIEGTVTPPEILLEKKDRSDIAKQVREIIDRLLQPQIKNIIEEVIDVTVTDFICDTTIKSNCTGAIVIFELKSTTNSNSD